VVPKYPPFLVVVALQAEAVQDAAETLQIEDAVLVHLLPQKGDILVSVEVPDPSLVVVVGMVGGENFDVDVDEGEVGAYEAVLRDHTHKVAVPLEENMVLEDLLEMAVVVVLLPLAVVDPSVEAYFRHESADVVEWGGDVEGSMVERSHKEVVT
jgi:hypothetical protein